MIPRPPPRASEPVSPINTCAGWQLNHRNPRPAPIMAAQKTVNSPAPTTCGTCRYSATFALPETYVSTRNTNETINVQPIARPSSPSVRLTALELPTMVNDVNMSPTLTPATPVKIGCFKNGTITSEIN